MTNEMKQNENEGLVRVIPDQMIEYLAKNNIFEDYNAQVTLEEISKRDDLTYDGPYNPAFAMVKPEDRGERLKYSISGLNQTRFLYHINSYIDKKDKGLPLDINDIDFSPYGHSSEFVSPLRTDGHFGRQNPSMKKLDGLNIFSTYSLHTIPKKTLRKIDATEFGIEGLESIAESTNPLDVDSREFSSLYQEILGQVIYSIPRIVTLLARDENEDLSGLPLEEITACVEKGTEIFLESDKLGYGQTNHRHNLDYLKEAASIWKEIASYVGERVQYDSTPKSWGPNPHEVAKENLRKLMASQREVKGGNE